LSFAYWRQAHEYLHGLRGHFKKIKSIKRMRTFIIAVLPVLALLVGVLWLVYGSFLIGLLCVFAASFIATLIFLWVTFVVNHFNN
jgi:hypothetical protein